MTPSAIASELRNSIDSKMPGLIKNVILYGSQARGDAHADSDIDILLVINRDIEWQEKNQIYGECSDLNLLYDLFIDVSILTESELHTIRGRQPFVQNAMAEGIVL